MNWAVTVTLSALPDGSSGHQAGRRGHCRLTTAAGIRSSRSAERGRIVRCLRSPKFLMQKRAVAVYFFAASFSAGWLAGWLKNGRAAAASETKRNETRRDESRKQPGHSLS